MTDTNNELRTQILEMVDAMNPKSYSRSLKSRPELLQEVNNYCSDFPVENLGEKLWLYVNQQKPKVCSEGNAVPFNSFTHGYRDFCSLSCKCRTSHHSASLRKQFKEDSSYASRMKEAREASSRGKYGVNNHMQSREFVEELRKKNLETNGYEFKIGTEEIKEKIKATTRANLGVDYAFQSKDVQHKARKTFEINHGSANTMQIPRAAIREKYGVDSTFMTVEGQRAAVMGMQAKYGVDKPFQSKELYQKFTNTMLARYNRPNPSQLHYTDYQLVLLNNREKFVETIDGKTFITIENETGLTEKVIRAYAAKYNCMEKINKRGRSKHEADIAAFLDSLGVIYKQDDRTTLEGKRELDFLIPEFNLAIELNGVYWHSELAGGKDKNYHKAKTDECDSKGIQLLSIFDSEWEEKNAILKSKIAGLCGLGTKGLGARKLSISRIDSKVAKAFLTKHHIQGHAHYSSYHIGAFDSTNNIRGVMSIRESEKGSEITRFASDAHHSGLFTKMLSTLVGEVFTFADRRVSKGDMYIKAGGKVTDILPPDYSYTWDYYTLEHKTNYRKEKIEGKFGIDIGNLTEWGIMKQLGFDRVWDSGKIKFTWHSQHCNY